MYSYDFYTGEPVKTGSPQSLSPPSMGMTEQEIINNATMYSYSPMERLGYNLASMGYNGQPITSPYAGFMNPPQPQTSYAGFPGNPAFQFMQNTNSFGFQGFKPQYTDYSYSVPGFNTGSTLLLKSDAEEECNRLQEQMERELEESNIKRIEQQKSYYSSLGYNYYGTPYVNQNYADPAIINKYKKKIDEMREEAEEARNSLYKNLSRLCSNISGEEIDEDRIEEIYSPHIVTIPAKDVEFMQGQRRFEDLVPFDNSEMYRKHDEDVSRQYREIFSESKDTNTFLRDCGRLASMERLEEESHKRRDMSSLYKQDGSYRQLIRQKIIERNKAENNGDIVTQSSANQSNDIPFGSSFPTLSQSATLLDDGTLSISAPAWLGDKKYIVSNLQEDEYEKNRQLFIQSIYRDNPKPNGGG